MTIKQVEIVLKGTKVTFLNVTFFQYHDGVFRIHNKSGEYIYSVKDFQSVAIIELEEKEPSLNLPFNGE